VQMMEIIIIPLEEIELIHWLNYRESYVLIP
jgi:hypothetical protein